MLSHEVCLEPSVASAHSADSSIRAPERGVSRLSRVSLIAATLIADTSKSARTSVGSSDRRSSAIRFERLKRYAIVVVRLLDHLRRSEVSVAASSNSNDP